MLLKLLVGLLIAFAHIPTVIKDVEDLKETSAILVFNDHVPNQKATCFIPMSETRKVHLKLEPVGDGQETNKLLARWTERSGVDPTRFKDAAITIFPK